MFRANARRLIGNAFNGNLAQTRTFYYCPQKLEYDTRSASMSQGNPLKWKRLPTVRLAISHSCLLFVGVLRHRVSPCDYTL